MDWDGPNSGSAVNYYRVEIDNDGVLPFEADRSVFTDGTTTAYSGIAANYSTTYLVRAVAADGVTGTALHPAGVDHHALGPARGVRHG